MNNPHTRIIIKLYATTSNIQLFLDKIKIRNHKTFRSTTLREVLKVGKSFPKGSKAKADYDNEIRSIMKLLSKLTFNNESAAFDNYINFVDKDLLLAYHTEHRYAVLVTKNGGKQRKCYTSLITNEKTKAKDLDYLNYEFKLDRDNLTLDECSRKSLLKTKTKEQKASENYARYQEYKDTQALDILVNEIPQTERIQWLVEQLQVEFGCNDTFSMIKHLLKGEVKTSSHDNVIKNLNSMCADFKRSQTQLINAEKKAIGLDESAIDVTAFKSVMPKPNVEEIQLEEPPSNIPPAPVLKLVKAPDRNTSNIAACLHALPDTDVNIELIKSCLNRIKDDALTQLNAGDPIYYEALNAVCVSFIKYEFNPQSYDEFKNKINVIRREKFYTREGDPTTWNEERFG